MDHLAGGSPACPGDLRKSVLTRMRRTQLPWLTLPCVAHAVGGSANCLPPGEIMPVSNVRGPGRKSIQAKPVALPDGN
jgi:hypothetical protein